MNEALIFGLLLFYGGGVVLGLLYLYRIKKLLEVELVMTRRNIKEYKEMLLEIKEGYLFQK